MARLARVVIWGVGAEGEALAEAIEARLRTGRALGSAEWVAQQEAALHKTLAPTRYLRLMDPDRSDSLLP